jgi:transposase
MPRAYSRDLRERVIAAVNAGQSRNAAARTFGLSVSCVVKWMQEYEATGRVEAKPMGGRRPYSLATHRVFVLGRLSEKPDLTISALEAELAERGVKVSRYAVWHFLRYVDLTFKKKPARQRTGSAGRRQAPRALEAPSMQARS